MFNNTALFYCFYLTNAARVSIRDLFQKHYKSYKPQIFEQ